MLRGGVLRVVAITPFEMAIGCLSVYSGVAGLFSYSPVAEAFLALPWWLSILTNLLYAISGIAIVGGLLRRLREVEAFGLAVLGFSLAIRSVVIAASEAGGDPVAVGVYVQTVVLSLALISRLWVLMFNRSLLLAEPNRRGDIGDAVITGAR
jgi:hypothetical protein